MKRSFDNEHGFTLIEILVSVSIMAVFLVFAASMLTNSRVLASYSKHRIQAAYAAEQIIETQRQNISKYFTTPISTTIEGGNPYVVQPNPQWVILDTQGNYTNINCTPGVNPNLLCGQAVITVTQSAYTPVGGGKAVPSSNVDHFQVQIYWMEQGQIPMNETYAADIANDPMLN